MDVHIVPGVKARDVAEAHQKDLLHQEEYGCRAMTYWVDEKRESIFCLVEAPEKKAVEEMHSKAHGLIPNKIVEVSSNVVESFLGRIYDPENAETSDDGLKVFSDPSFRVLLVTKTNDPVLLKYNSDPGKINSLLTLHNNIVRKNISFSGGSEVEHGGDGFIVSFVSASKAVACALAIQKEIKELDGEELGFRIGINGGEPLGKTNKLFGDTISLATHLSAVSKPLQVAIASSVKELVSKDQVENNGNKFFSLSPQDEVCLESLYSKLEENFQDPDFDVDDYCQAMAMSKSQLYRKTIALTGLAPNLLLKDFRLAKAKELMKKQHYNISQITFDSGFTSPSYFTKCFKKKYDLLPMAYLDLLH
jgi:AraC-type DNA-binding domain-containing proteins